MKIIEYHLGCKNYPVGCFGPYENFYTLFGSEIRFFYMHLFVSVFIGAVIFIAFLLLSKEKNFMRATTFLLLSLIATILLFFFLAYLFPIRVIY